jgi:hypothetical protein
MRFTLECRNLIKWKQQNNSHDLQLIGGNLNPQSEREITTHHTFGWSPNGTYIHEEVYSKKLNKDARKNETCVPSRDNMAYAHISFREMLRLLNEGSQTVEGAKPLIWPTTFSS